MRFKHVKGALACILVAAAGTSLCGCASPMMGRELDPRLHAQPGLSPREAAARNCVTGVSVESRSGKWDFGRILNTASCLLP